MQIARRRADDDFGEGETAQHCRYRRRILVPLAGIANQRNISLEFGPVRVKEGSKARAAGFLLALEQDGDLERGLSGRTL